MPAVRVDQSPKIDGVLDDQVWQKAALVEEFTQQEPREGTPAAERTQVRIMYDGKNLLIGVHAFDAQPSAIVATEMRRDSDRLLDEDNFELILDTFNDSRNGYMFVTTPLGAKLEQQISEEGEGNNRLGLVNSNINKNWDGIWEVAARITDDGWTAEIAIPLTTLRFADASQQTWGINFMRNIRRKNEQVFWAPIPKAYSLARVSQAGSLVGLEPLNHGLDLEKPVERADVQPQRREAAVGRLRLEPRHPARRLRSVAARDDPSITQYNSLTHEATNNLRFNFIYRPGSDIYIVYSDLQQTGLPQAVFAPSDRQLVVKMNYLLTR